MVNREHPVGVGDSEKVIIRCSSAPGKYAHKCLYHRNLNGHQGCHKMLLFFVCPKLGLISLGGIRTLRVCVCWAGARAEL